MSGEHVGGDAVHGFRTRIDADILWEAHEARLRVRLLPVAIDPHPSELYHVAVERTALRVEDERRTRTVRDNAFDPICDELAQLDVHDPTCTPVESLRTARAKKTDKAAWKKQPR